MSVTVESNPIEHVRQRLPQGQGIPGRLGSLRRSIRRQLLLAGGVRWAALLVALAGASLLVDRALRLERSSRLALGAAAAVALVACGWRWLVRPLGLRLADLDLAELVERRRPGLGQRIADALQLPDLLATPQYASSELVDAAVAEHRQVIEQFDFRSLVDAPRGRRNAALLAALVAAPLVVAAAFPLTAEIWARRWMLAQDIRWPQSNYLALAGLADGRRLLTPRGDALTLQLTAAPDFQPVAGGWQLEGRGEPLVVEGAAPRLRLPEQVRLRYRFAGGASKRGSFTHFAGADFRYELPPLVEPVELMIEGGDDWFGPIYVEPIDRPALAELKLISQPPGTEALDTHVVGAADEPLLFLPQTGLELQLAASEPLRRAEWIDAATAEAPQSLEQLDPRTFRYRWTMDKPRTIELRLVSEASGLASRPYFLTVGLLHDREPRLTLRASGVGRRVTPQARLPLAIHASDDFGLASLGLELERTELAGDQTQTTSKAWSLENFGADSPSALPGTVDRTPELALAEQGLAPGMSIRLRAQGVDGCPLGVHQGYSRWLGFQIVTPEELFYEILMRQREQRAKFVVAIGQAQAQAAAIEKLESLDGIPPIARVNQALGRQARQVAGVLDATLREMQLNDLGNPTAWQLLADRVIRPLGELHDGPFEQLRSQLERMRSGEAIDPADRDGALKIQQDIVRSMQGILEQMSQWESFIDVVNQLRNILKLQNELKSSTEQAQKKLTEQLFDE